LRVITVALYRCLNRTRRLLPKIQIADPSPRRLVDAEKQTKQQKKSSRESEVLPVAHRKILVEILSPGKAVNGANSFCATSLRVAN
jgi:hypothetical protein